MGLRLTKTGKAIGIYYSEAARFFLDTEFKKRRLNFVIVSYSEVRHFFMNDFTERIIRLANYGDYGYTTYLNLNKF